MITKEQVKQLIDKALEEYPQLFLIDFTIGANNHINIIIDGDQGVTIQDCVDMSRAVEHNLDREVEDFSLDVTSCGIFTPLTMERQYKKNIGRTLLVRTATQEIEAQVEGVENGQLLLSYTTCEPKPTGKGKITVSHQMTLPIEEIKEAKLVIKF